MFFTRLGRLTVRRRRLLLALTVLFMFLAAGLGSGVFGRLEGGGFDDPGSESTQARRVLEDTFGAGDPNLVLLVTAGDGSVDSEATARAGLALTEAVAASDRVTAARSYWTLGSPPPLRSTAGDKALVLARVDGTDNEIVDAVESIKDDVAGDDGVIVVQAGGGAAINADMTKTLEGDLSKAESIAIPITLVLLVLVFGSLVAAGLPLLVGLLSIVGTFLALFLISTVTDVSVYSINLTTALGLGLAIDYSLFIVSRYREELRNGLEPHDAVVRTVETAGRTVAFSALTVAVSLSALLVFPLYFLRSFAYAGIAVVLAAMTAALVSLPALLAVLGRRVDSLRLFHRDPKPEGTGFWYRVATAVMRRPVVVGVTVIALLLVLGAPFLRVVFGLPDDRALPPSAQSRQVSEALRSEFDGNSGESFAVVIDGIGDPTARAPEISAFAAEVSSLDGVARVTTVTGVYQRGSQVSALASDGVDYAQPTGTWLTVVPSIPLTSPAGEALVGEVRALDQPFAFGVEGRAAQLVDTKAAIADNLPIAAAIIVVATFVLLFLVFGSLLVPAKAIVLNLLSLTATFGAMVWIFQDGNLSGPLGFTATGTLDVSMPVLMFCIAFGLSMDYEVFLLSRIKEEHDRTGDNSASVALGLERTGRIVTAAAALLAVTFLAFATSGVSFIKLFGIGLALAVVMDATVIRGLLVPAFMKLAGEANWWAPAPLRRFHERFGISETGPAGPPADEVLDLSDGTGPRRSEPVG